LPPLTLRYCDFAAWQRAPSADAAFEEAVAYWTRHLADARLAPIGRPARLGTVSSEPVAPDEAAIALAVLSSAELEAVRLFAEEHASTMFILLVAAWSLVLSRLTGQRDLVVGTVVANRDFLEAEQVIGCFTNTIALRVDLAGAVTFADAVDRVRHEVLDAYANQHVPFERVTAALRRHRPPVRLELGTCLVLQNAPVPTLHFDGIETTVAELFTGRSALPLNLTAAPSSEGFFLSLVYQRALFDESSAALLVDQLRTELVAGCANADGALS
jgi:non-ribosomal peptide synthetase component F